MIAKFAGKFGSILFSNKFGPEKFVESFVYKMILHDPKFVYDRSFTTAGIEGQSKIRSKYKDYYPCY